MHPINTSTNPQQHQSRVHVVGVGLAGAASLTPEALAQVQSATLLIGAQRLLGACKPVHLDASQQECWALGNFTQTFENLRTRLTQRPETKAVVLASGDPLFFGIGRLLLEFFPAEQLVFHPQVSAIQLAFSRLKIPWQDATLVSVHGRGEALLVKALKRGDDKIAVLTDSVLSPSAIAALITNLELPISYHLWVCENLGGDLEALNVYTDLTQLQRQPKTIAALNVVVLLRQPDHPQNNASHQPTQAASAGEIAPASLPLIGLPDSVFKGFRDRPALMTKREVRLLVLGALAPLAGQVIWDVGAGTGSVSIELSRLCPRATIYAVEKTAMGAALIQSNAQRLAKAPIEVIHGTAPEVLSHLPVPDRVFIGGSSGQLVPILNDLNQRLSKSPWAGCSDPEAITTYQRPRVVLAIATLEHLSLVTNWVTQPNIASQWNYQVTQVNVSRSLPVGTLTRFSPLNPVTLFTLTRLL